MQTPVWDPLVANPFKIPSQQRGSIELLRKRIWQSRTWAHACEKGSPQQEAKRERSWKLTFRKRENSKIQEIILLGCSRQRTRISSPMMHMATDWALIRQPLNCRPKRWQPNAGLTRETFQTQSVCSNRTWGENAIPTQCWSHDFSPDFSRVWTEKKKKKEREEESGLHLLWRFVIPAFHVWGPHLKFWALPSPKEPPFAQSETEQPGLDSKPLVLASLSRIKWTSRRVSKGKRCYETCHLRGER